MFEYVGVIHVHSSFSDGTGKCDEIANYANEVGLDFCLLSDHNTLRGKDSGFEGWYGNSLLLIGCEINDKFNKNHYLAFGIDKTPSTRLPAKEYVKFVKDSGGVGFIAHPFEKRSSMKEHPPYPWNEWESQDFNGIEIWNHMSEWMEGLTEENKYNYFVHPLRSVVGPNADSIKMWDKLNQQRKVVGIGGIDAHAHKVNLLGFFEVEVFPYKVLFKSVRTHILSSEKLEPKKGKKFNSIDNDKKIIYSSLAEGRCFVSNFYRGDAKGFRFFAQAGGKIYQMGDTIKKIGKVNLKVILPNISGKIYLIRNGEVVDQMENSEADFIVNSKGNYRVEVFLDNSPWIYSNHIRIGD
ncbi:MAG: CehA/McbA family metallohydrolase [Ignavibacteriales bacterium]